MKPEVGIEGLAREYDAIVIGGGLAGLTAANRLGRFGHRTLLLEQHNMLGGLATWFRRSGRIFDVALHGFPIGMKKTCRKYWSRELADHIVRLEAIRFDNPQFSLTTTFDEDDFTRCLREEFGAPDTAIAGFFEETRAMNFYDDQSTTTRELFERHFPGRSDIHRFLMEPITYANGSTLEEPAVTYGIVFSNFMSKGVYTFEGGTDRMLELMDEELARNGVETRVKAPVERILVEDGVARGVVVDGREVRAGAVLSNANLIRTITEMIGPEAMDGAFYETASRVRVNNSSCQVYMGFKRGETLEPIGDLLFVSEAPEFDPEDMMRRHTTSRTFSVYTPATRPGVDQYNIVASSNARYGDWATLSDVDYAAAKRELIEETFDSLEKYVPNARDRIDVVEAATPRTFERYTRHLEGASFGTKFEGLKVSMDLKHHVKGLFHAGSVGIIMSGWLGAANYGAIVANDIDQYLTRSESGGGE